MVRQNCIIQRMDKEATVDIETEKLKYLCDIAEKYHGASKTSGAGGDGGITIINKDVDKEKIYDEWTKHGIKPLKFNIYHGNKSFDRQNLSNLIRRCFIFYCQPCYVS